MVNDPFTKGNCVNPGSPEVNLPWIRQMVQRKRPRYQFIVVNSKDPFDQHKVAKNI